MADGAAADIGLAHRGHRNSRLNPAGDPDPLQRRLHGERIHHRGQHAHIIGRGAFNTFGRTGQAAENIPAADHHTDLGAALDRAFDIGRNAVHRVDVNPVRLGAHQRFTGHLQQYPAVFRRRCHESPILRPFLLAIRDAIVENFDGGRT